MASLEASSLKNIYILVFKRCSRSRFGLEIEHRLVLRAKPYVKIQVKGVYQELGGGDSSVTHHTGRESSFESVKIKSHINSAINR